MVPSYPDSIEFIKGFVQEKEKDVGYINIVSRTI